MRDIKEVMAELSVEEVKRIRSLPMVEYVIGDTSKRGFFDREQNVLYCTDEDFCEFTEILKMNNDKADPLKYVSDPPAKEYILNNEMDPLKKALKQITMDIRGAITKSIRKSHSKYNQENTTSINANNPDAITPKEQRKQKMIRIAIILGALLLCIVAALQLTGIGTTKVSVAENEEANGSNLNNIVVVQVTRDMIPGDIITENDIQEATMSAQSYNEMTLGNSKFYQWDRHDTLLDKYVVSYIPKGQYLTYDNIDTVYMPDPNPWTENTAGSEIVHIPISKDVIGDRDLNYGSQISLKITERTVNEANLDPKNNNKKETLTHESSVEQSYLIDTYSLEATICDLLNDNGESLYNIFKAWLSIPAGEQLPYLEKAFAEDETLVQRIEPKYIAIKVTPEQADELGDIISDDSEIDFEFNRSYDDETPEKSDFIAEIQALFTTIGKAEEAASAAKEASTTEKE